MRKVTVEERQAGQRIDKVLRDLFPRLPFGALQRALRQKDIKANGIRVKQDYLAQPGDRLEIYIVDDLLDGTGSEDQSSLNKGFSIVYEDAHLLVANKEQGIAVHPDKESPDGTLIQRVQEYLQEKGEYRPGFSSFTPALCHRLDRNTGGLVLIAKTSPCLEMVLQKMQSGEIRKYYQCLVKGKPNKPSAELRSYLVKDERKSRVFVSDEKIRGALEIITHYKVLSYDAGKDIARLEVELVTGRTHQIRAHLAHIGHPIIGDGKYGTNAVNRPLGVKQQALWAYKMVFDFQSKAGVLQPLKGRKFEVEPEFPILSLPDTKPQL